MKYYFNHEFSFQERWAQVSRSSFEDSSLARFLDKFLNEKTPAGEVLVVGCGRGETCEYLSRKGWNLTGIDISPTAIRLAEKSSGQAGLKISYFPMDATDMSFSQRFDWIVDDHCLHCLVFPEDRMKYLQKVREYLKEDGGFILETLCFDKKARFPKEFLLDEQNILWQITRDKHFYGKFPLGQDFLIPVRKIIEARELETELIDGGLDINYFVYCPHLKMEIPGSGAIPMDDWPSLLRVRSTKRRK